LGVKFDVSIGRGGPKTELLQQVVQKAKGPPPQKASPRNLWPGIVGQEKNCLERNPKKDFQQYTNATPKSRMMNEKKPKTKGR